MWHTLFSRRSPFLPIIPCQQAELRSEGLKKIGVHNLSPGMVTTELLMAGTNTPIAKWGPGLTLHAAFLSIPFCPSALPRTCPQYECLSVWFLAPAAKPRLCSRSIGFL